MFIRWCNNGNRKVVVLLLLVGVDIIMLLFFRMVGMVRDCILVVLLKFRFLVVFSSVGLRGKLSSDNMGRDFLNEKWMVCIVIEIKWF